MTPNHTELLSAFFDGEAVDPDSLAASLEEPDGVDSLVEFARLRQAVREDTSRPTDEFSEMLRSRIARAEAFEGTRRRLVEVAVAASLALAAAAGGFGVRGLYDRQQVATSARLPAQAAQPRPMTPATPATPEVEPRGAPAVPAPVASAAGRNRNVPAKASVPAPNLRMLFTRWQEKVL